MKAQAEQESEREATADLQRGILPPMSPRKGLGSGSSIAANLATNSADDMTALLSSAFNELDSEAYTIEVLEVSEPVVEVQLVDGKALSKAI